MSRETLRKDISLLDQAGRLRQVRGGAMIRDREEPPVEERILTNPDGKGAIAAAAAALVPDGATILLDSARPPACWQSASSNGWGRGCGSAFSPMT
ncbi:MAG: hypothetical protein HPM95_08290 [Alphaproteobacteria bacterium]|nr:hypothetical protein [Alphaproteobacteria bacterium]